MNVRWPPRHLLPTGALEWQLVSGAVCAKPVSALDLTGALAVSYRYRVELFFSRPSRSVLCPSSLLRPVAPLAVGDDRGTAGLSAASLSDLRRPPVTGHQRNSMEMTMLVLLRF
jgi:hypothetical protein